MGTHSIPTDQAIARDQARAHRKADEIGEALQVFGKVIADLRTYSGKTKAQLAEKLEISRVTLNKIENGKSSGVSMGIFLRVWQEFDIFNDVRHAAIARDLVHESYVSHADKKSYPKALKTAALMNGVL